MSLSANVRRLLAVALCSRSAAKALCDKIDLTPSLTGSNLTVAGYFLGSSANALTAHAGGTQAAALQLAKQINNVTTVATAADSVKLPASVAGMEVLVSNLGANPMQVFGAGTDTINDVATATGVSQMVSSAVLYSCPVAGKWYANEIGGGFSGQLATLSNTGGLTAHASGTQAAALALTSTINRVTTVATAADSVKLPASAPGMQVTVINAAAANPMQVFGAGTDTIDGIATATGVSQPAGSVEIYTCGVAGKWETNRGSQNIGASTAAAGTTTADAGVLPAATARIYPTSAADDTKGVRVNAADQVTGRTLWIGNGVSNKILKVYGPSGAAINGAAGDAAFSSVSGKGVIITCLSSGGNTWLAW